MNFKTTYTQGKEGRNAGLDTGLPALNRAINGLQRKTSIGVAAAPKVGKTKFVDFAFLYSPYLQMVKREEQWLKSKELRLKVAKSDEERVVIESEKNPMDDIEWIYYSLEIDRVTKEFMTAAFFMAHDYGIHTILYKGKMYDMSSDYLMGRLLHEIDGQESELIPVEEEHEKLMIKIYLNRIVPLFGEYDEYGRKVRPGKIEFIEESDNPTGMYKHLFANARRHGTFIEEQFEIHSEGKTEKRTRIVGYTPNNPNKYTIIITDHVRKPKRERGFTMKENIDKWLEYSTFLRNICSFTFIHICHSNRGVANVDRLRMAGEFIFPTGEDVKDTGNLSEECTILITLFNPNDEKYNLTKHYGYELAQFPKYRSIHIVESRYTECPQHVFSNMFGGTGMFSPLLY